MGLLHCCKNNKLIKNNNRNISYTKYYIYIIKKNFKLPLNHQITSKTSKNQFPCKNVIFSKRFLLSNKFIDRTFRTFEAVSFGVCFVRSQASFIVLNFFYFQELVIINVSDRLGSICMFFWRKNT